jgi:hypothetical protein
MPNLIFRPSKLLELIRAQRGFGDREELVELRRWNPRGGEHRVRLATVMDLVLEEVQQQTVGALGLHVGLAMHADNPVRPVLVKRAAQ